MNTELKINGMHCEGCRSLIQMDLEDAGFSEKIKSLELMQHNTGKLELQNISEEDIQRIKEVINNTLTYQVAE